MRYGCCLNMVAMGPDGTGIEQLETLAACGYDYVELPLAELMALPDVTFEELAGRVNASGLRCEACNNMFPATFRLTGPAADHGRALHYWQKALPRLKRLGASVVTFGSGPAKWVPDGYPHEQGAEQVVSLLRKVGDLAEAHGLVVAIEPLCKAECNIVNTFAEASRLCCDIGNVHVGLLVDYYHLRQEEEPAGHVVAFGKGLLRHVHLACPDGRVFPPGVGEDYHSFFEALEAIGYDGRLSCEAYTQQFERDARGALAFLRGACANR